MNGRIVLSLFLILSIAFFAFDCSKKLTDKELLDLAQMEGGKGNFEKAVEHYETLLTLYPDSEQAPLALFMIGFTYANEIGNKDKARMSYKEFLEKYPNNVLKSSVEFELENMGKSAEDILAK